MRIDLGLFGRRLAVAAIVSVAWLRPAAAAAKDERIDVTIDFAKVMRLTEPAHTIVIGNPGIADASIGDEQTLILTGKTAGTTNLIVLDENGKEIVNSMIRVSSDIHQLTTVFYRREPADLLLRAGLRAGHLGRRRRRSRSRTPRRRSRPGRTFASRG